MATKSEMFLEAIDEKLKVTNKTLSRIETIVSRNAQAVTQPRSSSSAFQMAQTELAERQTEASFGTLAERLGSKLREITPEDLSDLLTNPFTRIFEFGGVIIDQIEHVDNAVAARTEAQRNVALAANDEARRLIDELKAAQSEDRPKIVDQISPLLDTIDSQFHAVQRALNIDLSSIKNRTEEELSLENPKDLQKMQALLRDTVSQLETNFRMTLGDALGELRNFGKARRELELMLETGDFVKPGVVPALRTGDAGRAPVFTADPRGDAMEPASAIFTDLEPAVRKHSELVAAINEGRGQAVESLGQFTTALDEAKKRLAECGCPLGETLEVPGDAGGLLHGAEGDDVLPGGAGDDLLGFGPGMGPPALELVADTTREAADEAERLTRIGSELGRQFSGALEAVILKGEGLGETLRALERQILDMLTQQFITGPLTGAIQNIGASAGAALGDLLAGAFSGSSGSFGFQHGGAFRVPGSGGPDSRLVPLRLSPGELVQVTPAHEVTGAGESMARNLNLNINVRVNPDLSGEQGFRKTGRQIAQDLSRQLMPVMRGM